MNALKWDKKFALEQAADDAELLQELLEIFKDSLHSDIQLIAQGLAENSAVKVCRAAHSIKGAAASLGILGIREIALAIEEESRGGDWRWLRRNSPIYRPSAKNCSISNFNPGRSPR